MTKPCADEPRKLILRMELDPVNERNKQERRASGECRRTSSKETLSRAMQLRRETGCGYLPEPWLHVTRKEGDASISSTLRLPSILKAGAGGASIAPLDGDGNVMGKV